MDPFQSYLLDKINDYRDRLNNESDENIRFSIINCLEEVLEIFSQYDLNYKL
ncbi:hypothetical protein [Clostridium cuniculi]|uniref:hypothetical protein n=1 Tax=Clostridium cuniculi TaxID=2548455 RepID=UPI00140FDADD|nr:hypothetical protein [Clostridium cuniculi]